MKHAPLEYVAERFPGGMNSFIGDFTLGIENISAAICDIDTFLKSDSEQFLGDGFTVNDTNTGNIRLDFDTVTLCEGDCACSAGGAWFTLDITITSELDEYDIKTPDSSNSVDDVALLIKNTIERAIDGSEISVKYKVLY